MNYFAEPVEIGWTKPFNQCLINGERVEYDACYSGPLEEAKELFQDRFTYIGSGFKTWHNGTENNWDEEHHFFNKLK
jgi:hypothetical protein